ncbi:hypothetical protein GP486_002354 [Trichoglossum hirsutum]|uniref:Uncharacterized protein n=1 Tax=Trichoglossum hirsutum TaxID=265104 RepID=A0A9P8LF81_9PEZI|nr:hypothetical protein GP486_002354 [Trichoglossum hirsutum]
MTNYRLVQDPGADSLYSGSAYFSDPSMSSEPIGEARNVYGKKRAKEEIAKTVLAFLMKWAQANGIELKETD